MFKQALLDGNVWLAIGMVCLAAFLALDHFAGASALGEFARGLFIGLSIVAYGAAVALLVRRSQPMSPPRRRTKGR